MLLASFNLLFAAFILTIDFVLFFSPPFSFLFSVLSLYILSTSSTFAFAFSFSGLSWDCVKIRWSIFRKYLVLPPCCPFSVASYENLQRAFSETSIQSSPLRSMLWPFSALIQVKRVSPLRLFSSCSPLLLVAKIFIALWSYRLCSLFAIEIHAAAFFGFSTLTAAFVVGLFTTAVSGPASFSPPGGYGERFAKLFNDQKAASLVDFADVITLHARTSHQKFCIQIIVTLASLQTGNGWRNMMLLSVIVSAQAIPESLARLDILIFEFKSIIRSLEEKSDIFYFHRKMSRKINISTIFMCIITLIYYNKKKT